MTLTCAKQRMIRGETQYNPVSRFVKEIPEELLDRKVPSVKRWDAAEYEEDSYERNHFKAKPFGLDYMQQYGKIGNSGPDTGLDGSGEEESRRSTGTYEPVFGKTKTVSIKPKPKATAVPKRTPTENRPFIAGGGVGALKGVNGLSKGVQTAGAPDYGVGDRVKHVKYGEGTVTNIEEGPRDYQVTVVFDGAGQKIMYAAFAKLKKL